MQPILNSTDLITAISHSDVKLLRKSDWCGRKAFLAYDGSDKWHVVVLNLVQRIKRWFGSQEFVNTRPNCLVQNLKDKDIETILNSAEPAQKAAAYRITRFHKKWLTAKLFVTQLTIMNKDIPQELIKKLLNHQSLLKKATKYLSKNPSFFYPTAGNAHLDIASYFIQQVTNQPSKPPTSEEMKLWGRLTEVLRRAGWDINGSRWPGTGIACSAFHFCAQTMKIEDFPFVDFYLDHGGNPCVLGTGYPPLFYYFKDEPSILKVVDYSKKAGVNLQTYDYDRQGYNNVLEFWARNGNTSVIKFYVDNGMSLDYSYKNKVLYNWSRGLHDPKLIMPFLKKSTEFTEKQGSEKQSPLDVYNERVKAENKSRKDTPLKELTIQDIETMFKEAHLRTT